MEDIQTAQFSLPGFDSEDREEAAPNLMASYTVQAGPPHIAVVQRVEYETRMFALPYGRAYDPNYRYPLEIKLTFNRETYRTVFQLTDREGSPLLVKDITLEAVSLQGFSIAKHLVHDTPLKTAVIAAFEAAGGSLPFRRDELDIETFSLLNRFLGFPRAFYDAIPFSENNKKIDRGFAEIAGRLRRYQNVGALYTTLGLPDKKRFKKAVMENPALLFYAAELQTLPFQNYDIMLKIITSNEVFSFLAKLHDLPGIRLFLAKLIALKGEAAAWKLIEKRMDLLHRDAAYGLLIPESRFNKLISGEPWEETDIITPSFNHPVSQSYGPAIPDEQIGPYAFVALRNTASYRKAARELRNCLARRTDLRVFGIMRNRRFAGAAAIDGSKILEALLTDNQPIDQNEEIFKAFSIWAEKNKLEYRRVPYHDELPF
jgi:hypothetical protein